MIFQKKHGGSAPAALRHVSIGQTRLKDAKNKEISIYTRLDTAYSAIICCASAVLEFDGLEVSSNTGHHGVMLDHLAEKLKFPAVRTQALRTLARSRNHNLYGGAQTTTEMLVFETLTLAENVMHETEIWLTRQAPAMPIV